MIFVSVLILKLLSLIVLFRGILGYEFRDNKFWVAAGFAVFAVQWGLMEVLADGGSSVLFYLVEKGIPTLSMMLIFGGRRLTVFIISLCTIHAFDLMDIGCLGIVIIYFNGDLNRVMDVNWGRIFMGVILTILIILSAILRKKRKRIFDSVEKLNPLLLLPFIPCWYLILHQNVWSSGTRGWENLQGENLIKNGLLSLVIIGAFFCICAFDVQRKEMKKMLRLNERCICEQTEQYRLLSNRDRELRKFRHDYNSHITALQNLAECGSREKLVRYIEGLAAVRSRFKLICSNNIICDAILNQYMLLCRDADIELKVKGNLPNCLLIPEPDLCVIVSNAVKNAYEAAKQCGGKRNIQVEFTSMGNFASIQIINTSPGTQVIRDGVFQTTKNDSVNHGIGMENMLEAAEKHGGKITWTCEKGVVITDILLRCKEK